MSSVQYIKNLFRDVNVASIAPTSKFGVRRLMRAIDFNKAKVIVEYGPGGGVITKALLRRMRPDCKLIALETNHEFADHVERTLRDPRLFVVRESAEDVLQILQRFGEKHADYILSGIPFSLFDVPKKDRILKATKEALGDDGSFLVYQFLYSGGKRKVDIKRKLNEHMRIINAEYEILNIPPLRIYHAVNGVLARKLREKTETSVASIVGNIS